MVTITELLPIPRWADALRPTKTVRSRFVQNPEVVARETAEGCTLFNPGNGTFVALDDLAKRVWLALDRRAALTIPELTDALVSDEDRTYWWVRNHVREVVMAMMAQRLVDLIPPTVPLRPGVRPKI